MAVKQNMSILQLHQLAQILKAEILCTSGVGSISRLLLDSRQFSSSEGVVFFALKGTNHDGHEYIPELIKKGVVNFVVEEWEESTIGLNVLKVEDSLSALQKLASWKRAQSEAKVIAITGSNGKTVVKEWLGQILQTKFNVCRSPKSYNSQIGVPLSLWELEEEHQFGVFEAGISLPGEMQKLEKMIRPDIGIFTNIGSAHDANFTSRDEKIAEKLLLFSGVNQLVYEKDNTELSNAIEHFAEAHKIQLLSWSTSDSASDLKVDLLPQENGSLIRGHFGESQFELMIPFKDEASIENIMHCLRLLLEFDFSDDELQTSFRHLAPVEMRLEMRSGSNGNLIINDAYNSDLESLRIALHYQENQAGERGRVLILSDMLQSGISERALNEKIAEVVNRFKPELVIGIGRQVYNLGGFLKVPFDHYYNTSEFITSIFKYRFRDNAILLKGARQFHFEEIGSLLEEKSHETVLHIHMNRLVANLNYYRASLNAQTGVMAMVKAFSYGSGSFEIANLLQFHKVDYLGVAYTDEGVALRKAGVSLPILVLNAEASSFQDLFDYRLEPEIYSLHQLGLLQKALIGNKGDKPFPIHIKLETGMNRLGFKEGELDQLLDELKPESNIRVASVFSHLAASDDPKEKDFTNQQISDFTRMCDLLQHSLSDKFLRHICNSGAITDFPHAHFDMVRLGIGLYGISSHPAEQEKLQVASELLATVSQVKRIEKGESVGYGRSFIAPQAMSIAVVSIGYADGFRRSLSNGKGAVYIKGQRCPVVGRVCMDMIMVEVADGQVKEGDSAEVFGDNITVYELAANMDTIPYEVLTGISQRVKRVYFLE